MNPLAAGAAGNVNNGNKPGLAVDDSSVVNSVANRMEKFGIRESVSNNNINSNNNNKNKNSEFESASPDPGVDPSVEFTTIIEAGHETLMKALRSRYRNIQSVSIMWSRGDIKVHILNSLIKSFNSSSSILNRRYLLIFSRRSIKSSTSTTTV